MQSEEGVRISGRSPDELAELFRLVAEATTDMIILGRDHAVEWISPAVEELLGYTPEEFIARGPQGLVHPDDLASVVAARPSIARGEQVRGRCRVLDRHGRYHWLEARVRPLPDADGTYSGRSISTWRDVGNEVEAMTQLRESEQRYRLLVENISDGVALERGGVVEWASPNLRRMLGWDPDEWLGRSVLELVPAEHRPLVAEALRTPIDGAGRTLRLRVPSGDGELHWIEIQARPFYDVEGNRDGTACSFRIVDAEVAAEGELEHRARYDQLTGLLNRKEIIDRLGAVGADLRHAGPESAVLFCDLDGFKQVNDTHGHAIGDEVLAAVAARVRASVREGDMVARLGGDELLVVLEHLHGIEDALAIADQIRRTVSQPIATRAGALRLTASIGATMVVPGDTSDSVIARADQAMYAAKEAGRDGIHVLPLELPLEP